MKLKLGLGIAGLVGVLVGGHGIARAESSLLREPERRITPFDAGRVGIDLGVGPLHVLDRDYIALGVGGHYFVLDGLSVGTFGWIAFGPGPTIGRLSVGLEYVLQPLYGSSPVLPYVSAYTGRWFADGSYQSFNVVGASAGLLAIAGRLVIGFGVAVEHNISDCSRNCDAVGPEGRLGVLF